MVKHRSVRYGAQYNFGPMRAFTAQDGWSNAEWDQGPIDDPGGSGLVCRRMRGALRVRVLLRLPAHEEEGPETF